VEVLAQAIQHAHDLGIIHRDIKPANILLAPSNSDGGTALPSRPDGSGEPAHLLISDCVPKVTDFGLAKLIGSVDAHTQTGDIVGTPGYLAPEQAEGDPARLGPAVDIYALGALLYELLTGRPPFHGATPLDTILLARVQDPIAPHRLQPRIPHDLEIICLKCLEKEPGRRYRSATDLAEELARFRNGQPIRARPATWMERTWKWTRRQPTLAALSAFTVLTILVSFAGITLALQQARQKALDERLAHSRADTLRVQAEKSWQQAEGDRHRAEVRAIRGFLERGIHMCERGDTGHGLVLLAHALQLTDELKGALRPKGPSSTRPSAVAEEDVESFLATDNPRWLAAYLERLEWLIRTNLARWHPELAIRLRARLEGHASWITDVAFSPDGKRAATASKDGVARLWEVETGQRLSELKVGYPLSAVRFSPDGRRLLTGSTGFPVDQKDPPKESFRAEAQLWDVATLQPVGPAFPQLSFSTLVGNTANIDFSPDGRVLVSQEGLEALRLVDPLTGKPWSAGSAAHSTLPFRQTVTQVAFTRNSQQLLTGEADGSLRRWSLATGLPVGETWKLPGPVSTLILSPDGRVVLGAGWLSDPEAKRILGGTARLWDLETGQRVTDLVVAGLIKTAAFSLDGRHFLLGGLRPKSKSSDDPPPLEGWVQLFETTTGKRVGPLLLHPKPVWSAVFSGDGSRVVTGCEDGHTRVWSTHSGKELGPQPRFYFNRGTVSRIARHPNGTTFLLSNLTDSTASLLLDVGPSRLVSRPLALGNVSINSLAFTPEGTLLTGDSEGTIRFWNSQAGETLPRRIELPQGHAIVRFSPDGRFCLVRKEQADQEGPTELWDLQKQQTRMQLDSEGLLSGAAFSPDGRLLATASSVKQKPQPIRLWDTDKELQLRTLEAPGAFGEPFTSLALSSNRGLFLGAIAHHAVRTPWLWDVASGKVVCTFPPQSAPVKQVAFGPRDRMLVATLEGEVRLWEKGPDQVRPVGLTMLHREEVRLLRFSPDGRSVLTGAGKQAFFWDPITGLRLGPALDLEGTIRDAAFHPRGQLLATADDSRQVRLWKVPSPLKGSARQIQTWVEAITRLHLQHDPVEAILPLEDREVGQRSVRLRTELGGIPE